MSKVWKAGAPPKLTPEIHNAVLDAIPRVLVLGQVAGLSRVPRSTLQDWLVRGDEHRKIGTESEFAQFSADVREAQAKEVEKLLKILRTASIRGKSSAQWLLERCFREDFGLDAHVIVEMVEKVAKLEQALSRYLELAPLQGAVTNG